MQENGEPYWHEFYASDPEHAVEKFADAYDRDGDYTIVQAGSGGEFVILVRKLAEPETVMRFRVYGESVPQYHAEQITETA